MKSGYSDLREYIEALDRQDMLWRIKRKINKDTELMPLVRWQYRGLPATERKGFLFENVTDVKGKKYDGSVAIALWASIDAYALAMRCEPNNIRDTWTNALRNPIKSELVHKRQAPVKEEIHAGDKLEEHGGLEEFPIPISLPGFDPAPFITAPCVVTKDPETGVKNVGTYRAMVKGKTYTGIETSPSQHIGIHFQKWKRIGKPMPAAVVIGPHPAVAMTSVSKIPFGTDELEVSGGIAGEPMKVAKCETIDLEVPATAEIVLEGEIPTDYTESEGPFGEYRGYMGVREENQFVFRIRCITHREKPIYHAFIAQYPPSEGGFIRKIGLELPIFRFLKEDCNIPGVLEVFCHEESGSNGLIIIRLEKFHPSQVLHTLRLAATYDPGFPKLVIAVDKDIDPTNLDAIMWALVTRVQPHRDIQIFRGKVAALDPSAAPMDAPTSEREFPEFRGTSVLLVDATMKWPYPPVALPKKEFMRSAMEIWKEVGLPKLTIKKPWYGYSLGYWSKEYEDEAELALRGRHYETAEKLRN